MKKTLFLAILLLYISNEEAFAQWTNGSIGSIYYNGKVGINTSNPSALLDVVNNGTGETAIFRSPALGNQLSHIHHGSTGNWYIRSSSTTGKVILQDAGGNVGIGTSEPHQKLHVKGRMVLEPLNNENPTIFTGTGSTELNRYLFLLNSSNAQSGSGLKASGILVSDSYSFANPGKNDLVVKGNIGIGTGTVSPNSKLTLQHSSGAYLNLISVNESSEILLGADQNGGIISTMSNHDLNLRAGGNINRIVIKSDGNVGIGTNSPGEFKLAVAGKIKVQEVKVTLTDWPDYVFESSYSLPTLEEVEIHIKEKGHLKDIPSATDVEENGVNLGEMDAMLLKKIEELTLYMINLKEENDAMKQEIKSLQKQIGQ